MNGLQTSVECPRNCWSGHKVFAFAAVFFSIWSCAPVALSAAGTGGIGLRRSTDCGDYVGHCLRAPRPQDQVFVVSTRRVCSTDFKSSSLEVTRFEKEGAWTSSSAEELYLLDDPAVPTCIWIHGNRVSSGVAKSRGLSVYHRIVDGVPQESSLRFIIWSWPSTQIPGIIADVRAKAVRTDIDGYYLGCFLSRMESEIPVTLIGFSFGPRIMTGALHVMAGGSLKGRVLAGDTSISRKPIRAVMMAAALHQDWLLPGAYHGNAMAQVDQMLLFNNSCDPVLRHYRFVFRSKCTDALGYRGLACRSRLGDAELRITQKNVCRCVGGRHEWSDYINSNRLMASIRQYVFSDAVE